MTCITIFEDSRLYGDYRGPDMNRSRIVVEHEDDHINVFVEDGDAGGRGAEREFANHEMSLEQARALMEALHPILYGSEG